MSKAPNAFTLLNRWPALLWLNVSFYLLFIFWTALLSFVAIPFHYCYAAISRNQRRGEWLMRRTISNYGMAVIHSGFPLVRVRYIDHAPHEKPPFIFVANHRSMSDAFLMAFIPLECVQVINIWPSRVPIINYLSKIAGYIRIREVPFEQFISDGARLLGQGVSIIAFPEGTRSGSREMGPFHGSAFRLAQHTGAKICPLAISGNENIPRRGSLLLHPGNIVVAKLPSVTAEQYKELNPYELKTRVRETIHRHLEAQPA